MVNKSERDLFDFGMQLLLEFSERDMKEVSISELLVIVRKWTEEGWELRKGKGNDE